MTFLYTVPVFMRTTHCIIILFLLLAAPAWADDAFQRAVDAGGTVTVDREIVCDAPLLVGSNTRIVGATPAATLKFTFATWQGKPGENFYVGNRNRRNADAGDVNITLENLNIVGAGTGEPAGDKLNGDECYGLSFRKVSGLRTVNCRISNIPVMGIVLAGCDGVDIGNVSISGTGRDGINGTALFDAANSRRLAGVRIRDCVFSNLGDDAIALYSCTTGAQNLIEQPTGIVVSGNVIRLRETPHKLAQGRGIVFSGVSGVIQGNTISGTPSNGIACYRQHAKTFATSDFSITGNVLNGCGSMAGDYKRSLDGIYIRGDSARFAVGSNVVTGSIGRDINIVDSRDGRLTGNVTEKMPVRTNCINVTSDWTKP